MEHYRFTEEALKAMDGQKVPLTLEFGGPVIGESTLRYVPEVGVIADLRIDHKTAGFTGEASAVIFRKES